MTPPYAIRNTQYAILLVYLALAALFALTTPSWQNPDEPAHYNTVAFVATEGRLPVLQMGDYDEVYLQRLKDEKFPPELSIAPVRYEFHQPPLYYILAAPVYWLSGGSLLALRLFSALLGAGVIWLLSLCFQTVFPEKPGIVLAATAFVAFLPMHIAILAAANNDALAELIIAGGLLVLLRWVKEERVTGWQGERVTSRPHTIRNVPVEPPHPTPPHSREGTEATLPPQWGRLGGGEQLLPNAQYAIGNRQLLLLGLIIGLGFLTKATAYILLPVVIITIATVTGLRTIPIRNTQYAIRTALSPCHPVILSSLLLGLPLWLRNIATYGGLDFLGLGWHDQVVTGQPTTADWIAANGWPAYWERAWDFTFKSFWGVFGWLGVFMDGRVYTLLLIFSGIVAVGLIAGLLRFVRKEVAVSDFQRWGLFVALLLLAAVFASYAWYNLGFVQHQGRYLFPALFAFGLLVALGWREALRARVSFVIAGLLLLWAVILAGSGLVSTGPTSAGLDKWALLFLAGGSGALLVNGLLERIPGGRRLRPILYALPFVLLILLDAAIPFLYTVPQLAR